jgi:endoglucanase
VLLTRAEEEGFVGAIAAAQDGKLLKKSDRLISIECSAEQSYAKQSDGVVIRVGDRTSVFNSAFTYFIRQQADALADKWKDFKFQTALMPGGTCEGTVFDAWGYIAAAVCVPLGNYHNMNMKTGKIGPEYVDLRDWNNMVRLLTAVAKNAASFTSDHAELKKKLLKRFDRYKPLL